MSKDDSPQRRSRRMAGLKGLLTRGQKRTGNINGLEDDNDTGLAEALKLLRILVRAD